MEEDILGELHDLSNHVLFVNERAIGKIASLSVDNDRLRQQVAELVDALDSAGDELFDAAQTFELFDALPESANAHEACQAARAAIAKTTGGE